MATRLNCCDILVTSCGCHLHLGGIQYRGNGFAAYVKRKGKMLSVHRVTWEDKNGQIPNGLWVLHKCDVGVCVNINHLYLGTAKDNAGDRVKRNRSGPVSDAFRFSMKGKPHTDSHNQKIGEANKRRVIKQSTREKHRHNAIKQWNEKRSLT